MASSLHFLREVKEELYKVSYPSTNDVVRLTAIVIFVSLGVAVLLSGLDYVFGLLFSFILKA